MNDFSHLGSEAFGAPGMPPRWTPSTKEGIGTAYHVGSRIWFTLSHGIVNEIYYPTIDTPNTRDLQFLITDGESFLQEERRDFDSKVEYPENHALLYQLTNTEQNKRYRIHKEILTDPHAPVLMIRCRIEILDESLRGKLKVFALLSPHVKGLGQDNDAATFEGGGRPLLHACRDDQHLVFGASPDFKQCSVGYVGASDGWQDLHSNFQMNWHFTNAPHGNTAMMGEVDFTEGEEFTLAVAMGGSRESATAALCQSTAIPYLEHRKDYIRQWQCTHEQEINSAIYDHTPDQGSMFRLSRCILLAHEDKTFPGAMIASLSIPWGESKDDRDLGGYHLVWPRDMMHSAMALLAAGQTETPLRSLVWMSCIQQADGSIPQNSWITGRPYWCGTQLDEAAAPILLAWHLHQANALADFDPWLTISRAAAYLILRGPVTGQERWEENAGYSPSTLAAVIAALVCAAEFAKFKGKQHAADSYIEYADWLSARLEKWTVTSRGELLDGTPRHYIRINPADPMNQANYGSPDDSWIDIQNGGGRYPARNVVDAGFLELVRYGIRAADDPIITDSVKVIDHVLKVDLPQGPGWRRYNHDGYGQKKNGDPFDGHGKGGCWPLLTGERGHYELALGNDPAPYLKFLHDSANHGGMLPEQVWSENYDIPEKCIFKGKPTGSAMPLCWAHAEYISLIKSRQLGRPLSRIEAAYQRYVIDSQPSEIAMWTTAHQTSRISRGQTLRILTDSDTWITSWPDGCYISHQKAETTRISEHLWSTDITPEEKDHTIIFSLGGHDDQTFRVLITH